MMTLIQLETVTRLYGELSVLSIKGNEWFNVVTLNLGSEKDVFVWADGRVDWHFKGLRHRPDGPGSIWPDGIQAWWLNGLFFLTEEEHKQEVARLKERER